MTRPFDTITIQDVARLPRPGMAIPGAYRFTPDGTGLTYLHSAEGSLVRSLWLYELATGTKRVLAGPPPDRPLSREEELLRERLRIREMGVTSYQFAREASQRTILIPGGPKLRLLIGDAEPVEIDGTEAVEAPRISPDGQLVAFVRAGDLYVAPVRRGSPRRLTHDADDGLTNGLAEFIAQEELDRTDGFWWSHDSRQIAFIRADSRHIPRFPIVHQGKDDLDVEYHRYPFAGQRNAALQLAVVDIATGDTRWLDLGPDDDFYIVDVAWRRDGLVAVQQLSRDQRDLAVILFDPATGQARHRFDEHNEPWINTGHNWRFLRSGELLWTSERTGFRHLYLYDPHFGDARQLTAGDWMVTSVAGVHEASRTVFFQATADSVLERHLYAVSLDGGEIRRLTSDPGWHDTIVSDDGTRFVDTVSSLERAPVTSLRRADGSVETVLFDNDGASAASLGLSPPRLLTLEAADGTTLHGALYEPPDPARVPPPVIVSVYGGPHAQRVANEWSLTVDLRAQYLARQGYAVFKLDNRGSANRGLAFEAALAGRMGTIEIDDQAAGVRQLARRGLVDGSRAGIFGWSYGGYVSALALMRAPELFTVAVAGAPVTHWDGYDTCYTERYMRTPSTNPEGYREAAVMTHVHRLEGHLLLVHGLVDENVHFRHTARLITALTAAGKPYDLLVFPEERHVPRDAAGLEYQERRLAEYFLAHLPPGEP
ncbi:MAG: S9 family peptidase [Dehalococcoidia bacterium]